MSAQRNACHKSRMSGAHGNHRMTLNLKLMNASLLNALTTKTARIAAGRS